MCRHIFLVAALIAAAAGVSAQQPLPTVPLDQLPDAPRKAIGSALDDARAHPSDPQRLGRLGMLLHAWEQYQTASMVYVRAAAVERRFDWFYLAGVVQSRLARHIDAARLLKEAVALDPTSVPARLALADALFASDEIDAALAEYMRLTDGSRRAARALWRRTRPGGTGGRRRRLRELEAAVALTRSSARPGTPSVWRGGTPVRARRPAPHSPGHRSSARAGPPSTIRSSRG